jgi:hypothetical protein
MGFRFFSRPLESQRPPPALCSRPCGQEFRLTCLQGSEVAAVINGGNAFQSHFAFDIRPQFPHN